MLSPFQRKKKQQVGLGSLKSVPLPSFGLVPGAVSSSFWQGVSDRCWEHRAVCQNRASCQHTGDWGSCLSFATAVLHELEPSAKHSLARGRTAAHTLWVCLTSKPDHNKLQLWGPSAGNCLFRASTKPACTGTHQMPLPFLGTALRAIPWGRCQDSHFTDEETEFEREASCCLGSIH